MPQKKAPKPNGFVLFAQDLQNQHGRKYASLKEAIDAAAPLWQRMSRDQKKAYDDRAKAIKGQSHPTRYTSEGLDVEHLTREEQLKIQAEEKAREDIRNLITLAYRRGEDALASERFFVIHINIFCHYAPKDHYFPAEIAVLGFNLKDGVKEENIFHSQVEPGPLPIGYKFQAKQHSDETHLLPVPLDDTNDNQEEVYGNLKAFLEKKKSLETKRMPILFADKKNIKMIQNILDTWCEMFDTEPELFRVYSLQVMFYFLRNTVAGEPVWSSLTFADRELEKDVYAYVASIACPLHGVTARPLFCSQSITLRYAYVICDNCCPDLNIELEPGQHVPLNSTVPDTCSTYGSTTHSSRSSVFSERSRGFNSDFDTESNADTWDTESMISNASSTMTTINLDDQFPALGGSQSQSSTTSGLNTSGSVWSYAGATGKSKLPAAFEKSVGSMSLNSSTGAIPKGRGFRRRVNDSDSDTSSVVGAPSLAGSESSDFPPIGRGRGRGFVAKKLAKPGVGNN